MHSQANHNHNHHHHHNHQQQQQQQQHHQHQLNLLSSLLNCGAIGDSTAATSHKMSQQQRGVLNGLCLNTLNTTPKQQQQQQMTAPQRFNVKSQSENTANLNANAVLQLIYQQQLVNEAAVAAAASLNMTDASGCPSQSAVAAATRYKTELCRSFQESGQCKYGDKCQFAHGQHELRNMMRHPRYKTELCRTFHAQGYCPYGPRCHFVHDTTVDRNTKQTPKTSTSKPASPVLFEYSAAASASNKLR